ncbi:hypothetical protein SprV_0602158500 [Sparganum proliferum]
MGIVCGTKSGILRDEDVQTLCDSLKAGQDSFFREWTQARISPVQDIGDNVNEVDVCVMATEELYFDGNNSNMWETAAFFGEISPTDFGGSGNSRPYVEYTENLQSRREGTTRLTISPPKNKVSSRLFRAADSDNSSSSSSSSISSSDGIIIAFIPTTSTPIPLSDATGDFCMNSASSDTVGGTEPENDSSHTVGSSIAFLHWLEAEFKQLTHAVNTSPITTFGTCSFSLDIGLRRLFPCVFVVADIPGVILGADFLAAFDLLVDWRQSRLHDKPSSVSGFLGSVLKLDPAGQDSFFLEWTQARISPVQDIGDNVNEVDVCVMATEELHFDGNNSNMWETAAFFGEISPTDFGGSGELSFP